LRRETSGVPIVGMKVGPTGKVEGDVFVGVICDGLIIDVDNACGGGLVNAGKSAKLRVKLGGGDVALVVGKGCVG
jgi:hypothetical protein